MRGNNYSCVGQLFDTFGESLSSRKNVFTPTTPYVHKFRTEICRNYELYGKCRYGDEVGIKLF